MHLIAGNGVEMKYFEMFAGIGGFSIGIHKADNRSECVGFSEIDKYASMVLKYRYPEVRNYGDCTRIDWRSVPDFDMLVGGSPCQSFSISGKRKGLSGTSGLVWEYLRCLTEKKPKYFMWENVTGALSSRRGLDFANILAAFSQAGYSLWWQILTSKDFNSAQNRERIFIIGFREEMPKKVFFVGQRTKEKIKDKSIIDSYIKVPSATKSGYEKAREGDSIRLSHIGSSTGRGRVGHKQSQTLTLCGDMYVVVKGLKVRRLTPIECCRLMGWEDTWTRWGINHKGKKIRIPESAQYRMAGNGVVSNVIAELYREVILCR